VMHVFLAKVPMVVVDVGRVYDAAVSFMILN